LLEVFIQFSEKSNQPVTTEASNSKEKKQTVETLSRYLFKAGVFFDMNAKVRLLESFHSIVLSLATTWEIDKNSLETFIWGSEDARDGIANFFEMECSQEQLLEKVTSILVEYYKINQMNGIATVKQFLSSELRCGLSWKHVKMSIVETWYERAQKLGLISGQYSDSSEKPISVNLNPTLQAALKTLELKPSQMPSERKIKGSYRKLLFANHPDMNPKGTEKTKEINAAYATLLSVAGLLNSDINNNGS